MSFLVGFATGAMQEVNRRYDAHRDEVREREDKIRDALERAAPEIAKRKEKAANYNTRYNLAISYGAPEHMAHAYSVSDMGDDILATNIRQYKLAEQTRAATEASSAPTTTTSEAQAPTLAPTTPTPDQQPPSYKTTPPPPTPTTPMRDDPNKDRSFVDAVLGVWPKGSAQYSAYEAIASEKGVGAEDVMKEYSDILAGQFGPSLPEAPPTPAGAPPLVFVTEQQAMEKANEFIEKNKDGFRTPEIAKKAFDKFYNAYLTSDGPGMNEAMGLYDVEYANEKEAAKRGSGGSGELTQGQLRNQLMIRLQPYFQGDIVTATDQYGNTTASIREKAETGATIGGVLDEAEARIIEAMGPNMQKIPLGVVVQMLNQVAAERGLKRGQPVVPGYGGTPGPGQNAGNPGQPGQPSPPPPPPPPVQRKLSEITDEEINSYTNITNLQELVNTLDARINNPTAGAPVDRYKQMRAVAAARMKTLNKPAFVPRSGAQ